MKYLYLIPCALLYVLSACTPKERPVPAHEAGDVITANVNMESNYQWQIYYDLETNKIVSQNQKTAWDIAFEASENGDHVILNGSKSMFAWKTNRTSLESVTDTVGFGAHKQWDAPSGNLDSTAIEDWQIHDNVYLIDRGYTPAGTAIGFVKIKMRSVSSTGYVFDYASLNNSYTGTCTLNKDNDYNFIFFSFDSKAEVLQVEPPKTTWDLCFTQYTHTFYNPTQAYLVTGCLINRYNTQGALESRTPFQNIAIKNIDNYTFSSKLDIIGYSWKDYTGSIYVTDANKVYLIKNRNNIFFKLHFIDFYNSSGQKGNPTWECQEL